MKIRNCKLKIVIFTDLDGTLLDHMTYSFDEARPALNKIKETETPIVFVTSKTFAEVEAIQKEMGIWGIEPFIVENGGAVFLPKRLFEEKVIEGAKSEGDFFVIKFGKPYREVRGVLKETAEAVNLEIRGIGDMTAEEFAEQTGLTLEQAGRAKKRQFQEGFKILVPKEEQKEAQEKIKAEIEKRGFHISIGGRFCQIMGSPSKIKAVETLINLFEKKYGEIHTVGLGDAQADLEFIELCDEGFLVKNPKKAVGAEVESEKIHLVKEIGPAGWNEVVLEALKEKDLRFRI